ncbi:hypothetical protein GQ42DRAFT_163667 [Ramicandelaber brevisporus]|nr:hypothetical protein GQ42DRAFT_163667 [Ramicandelaber brevisporus]
MTTTSTPRSELRQRFIQAHHSRGGSTLGSGFLGWLNFLFFLRRRLNKNPPTFATASSSGERSPAAAASASASKYSSNEAQRIAATKRWHPFNDLEANAKEYDYVIVGGGTAGIVVASRLSEDPNTTVLVIEAGDSDEAHIYSRIPASFSKLWRGSACWQFYTEPEPELKNRKLFWPRGKMLGGSSAANAMVYQKCPPSDYDDWEQVHGCKGWNWAGLEPYFTRAEGFTPPSILPQSGSNTALNNKLVTLDGSGQDQSHVLGYRTAAHNTTGPVITTPAPDSTTPVNFDFVAACSAAGIPRHPDLNDQSLPCFGVSTMQRFITPDGHRSSTNSSYLPREVLQTRPNLTMGTYGRVSRILFERSSLPNQKPRARGVEIVDSSNHTFQVRAKREVILCAGAVQSPQILMLSGIGPREEIEKHGLTTVVNVPGVGHNLQDHLHVNVAAKVPRERTLHMLVYTLMQIPPALYWVLTGAGPLARNMMETYGFFNTHHPTMRQILGRHPKPDSESRADHLNFPAGADTDAMLLADRPNIEITSACAYNREHALYSPPLWSTGLATYMAVLLKPYSTGRIILHNADPLQDPKIVGGYLTDPRDLKTLIDGIRVLLQINKHMICMGTSSGMYELDGANVTDEQIADFIRERGETLYHPTSTCKMGPLEDPMTVVDTNLKVRGVDGLRVVDASVFPSIPRGHTAYPCIAIAEKASDIIRASMIRERQLEMQLNNHANL